MMWIYLFTKQCQLQVHLHFFMSTSPSQTVFSDVIETNALIVSYSSSCLIFGDLMRGVADFDHTYWFTSLCPVQKRYQHTGKIECCSNKRVPLTSPRGPLPNTSAAVWQGPRRHLKGTTVEKINLAASFLGPAAERGREIEKGREGSSWEQGRDSHTC